MSESIRNELAGQLAVADHALLGRKARVMYNFTPLPELAAQDGRSGQPVTLFFIGNIGQRKGVFDLITAVARLQAQEVPPFQVVLAGPFDNAATEAELKRRIDEASLGPRVQFTGPVLGSRKESLFRSADIFVLPSYGEGLPMSLLEAMSYAMPSVSTEVGGIPEVLVDGESGYLIKPGDIEGLCAALAKLMGSAGLRKRMGQCGRARVERCHAPGQYLRSLEAIYREVLDSV